MTGIAGRPGTTWRWLLPVAAALLLPAAAARAQAPAAAGDRRAGEERLAARAEELSARGEKLRNEAKLAEAAKVLRECLEINRRLYPKERFPSGHAALARSIDRLASAYKENGDYARAEPLCREALAMRRALYPVTAHPRGHSELAESLSNLAELYWAAGDFARALPLSREALAMRRALYPASEYPAGHPELAESLNNLALFLDYSGDYAGAEPLAHESADMYRKLYPAAKFPDGHPKLADSLNNLAGLYFDRGDHVRSRELFAEALRMRRALYPRKDYPRGNPELAESVNNLAFLCHTLREFEPAESLYREAVEMKRALYPAADFPRGHPNLALSINSWALMYQDNGQFARAEALYREALRMRRDVFPASEFPRGHPELSMSAFNLGCLYLDSGDYPRAEPLLREALAMRRALYPHGEFPRGHPALAESAYNLAVLHQARGEYAAAVPLLREALVMYRSLADAYCQAAAEAEALNLLATEPLVADALLSATRRLPGSPDCYDLIWDSHAPLFRLLQGRRLSLSAARDAAAAEMAARLQDARLSLSGALLAPGGVGEERLRALTTDKEKLERALASRLGLETPGLAGTVGPAELRAVLPDRTAFVEFVRYTDTEEDAKKPGKAGERRTPRYAAFLTRKGRPVRRVELGEAGPIEAALAEWRKAIVSRQPDRQPAAAVARLLWEPLRGHLPDRVEAVWLYPSEALCQVPWAALPGKEPDTVLLEEHAVAVVPHGSYLTNALAADHRPGRGVPKVLVLGGVDYDQAPSASGGPALVTQLAPAAVGATRKGVSFLPKSVEEVARVGVLARTLLKAEPVTLSGRQAGVAQLLTELPGARYAHLATHGFFADASVRSALRIDEEHFRLRGGERAAPGARNPLVLSGLVLAGANRAGKDGDRGILTAEGIVGLNLEGMDLAVLSACETGLGEVAGREGVLGLVRAFHVAGAKNVLASLWAVEDHSTAALMGRFYEHLWAERLPPLEALRRAQIDVYRNPNRLAEWASRGIGFDEKALRAPAGSAKAPPPGERTRTGRWAAFVLSGAGR